ncbi:MAG: NADH-quinone oxidoreductase subunit L, partial [Parvibaculales bacterium]
SWRLMFMTFHGTPRVSNEILSQAHEPPFSMMVPLLLLAGGALLSGWLFHSAFIGHHQAEFWAGAIFTNPENHILEAAHHVPKWVKLMPVLMMSGGFLLAWFFYILAPSLPHKLAGAQQIAYRFLLHKWYFDEIYDFLFVMPARWLARLLWKKGDGAIIDGLGPNGISAVIKNFAAKIMRLQTGYLYHYAFAMLIGICLFVSWFIIGGLK